jgi:hypothetical protein
MSGLEPMPESDRRHAWPVKALIVMIVFPVLLLACLYAWSVLLYTLAWVLPAEGRGGR